MSAIEQFVVEHLNDELDDNLSKEAMLQLATCLRQEAKNEMTAAIGMDHGDSCDSSWVEKVWFDENDEELKEPRVVHYNISKDSGHKFLFEKIEV